ncbi:MAG: PKD domain-containing protein, partial [Candidatus Nanohaloarchaea archaeon]
MKEENIDEAVREALREEFGDDFSEEKIEGLKQKVRDRLEKKEAKEAAREEMDGGISRRRFLKLAGLGAGGLGLSSMGAASFVDITSGGSSSMTLSDVMSNGNDVGGLDIVDSGTTVYDSSNSWVPASSVEQGDGSGLDADSVDSHDISSGSLANRPSAGVSGRLYVTTDGNGVFYDDGSSWSQVSGKVNDPPTASFTYSPSNPSINESISFDGSGSSDDGYIYKYEWDWTDDGNYEATGETASHSYSSTGDYTVVLRVEDAEGASSTISKSITVTANVLDNFEDGDLSEYSGQTGTWSVTNNSPVYDGSYSLKATGNGNFIYRNDVTMSSGNKYEFYLHSESAGDDSKLLMAVQDSNNYYRVG